jgi:hypothetical protein
MTSTLPYNVSVMNRWGTIKTQSSAKHTVNAQNSLNHYLSTFSIRPNSILLTSLGAAMENQVKVNERTEYVQENCLMNLLLSDNDLWVQSEATGINSQVLLTQFFCGAGDQAQGLAHAPQTFYHWSTSPAPSFRKWLNRCVNPLI